MVVLKLHLIYPFVSRKAYTSPNRAIPYQEPKMYRLHRSPLTHSRIKLPSHFLQKYLPHMLNLNMKNLGKEISSHGLSGNNIVGRGHWYNVGQCLAKSR